MNLGDQHINKFKEFLEESDIEKKLESARITLDADLKPPPPVIQVDNQSVKPITIFTEGNISVIQGRAKARKSFAVAMFVGSALSDVMIYKKFVSVPRKLVVYFDTEQSSFYVQQAIQRIFQISKGDGFEKRFLSFCLRPYNPEERVEIIEYVFEKSNNLGFVVIDGIRDLVKDINSPDEATMITSKLLKWSERTGAHILTVLHENKEGGKARGHIGSELVNKAETILKVEKMQNKYYSKITCEMVRGLDFDPIYFVVEDNVPIVVENPPSEVTQFE